jgi:hypothetical protein
MFCQIFQKKPRFLKKKGLVYLFVYKKRPDKVGYMFIPDDYRYIFDKFLLNKMLII